MVRAGLNKPDNLAEAERRLREVLHARGLRWTGERRGVLEAVEASPGHFTVDDLVERLRKRGMAASRATVYRALPLLVEAGLVRPMVLGGEVRRYEAAVGRTHHDHLVCSRCATVIEFEDEAIEVLQREVARRHGFELVGHLHELVGVCPACRKAAASGETESRQ